MFCIYCGNTLTADIEVCGYCGRSTSGQSAPDPAGALGVSPLKICPNCRTPMTEIARFCGICGGTVTVFAPPDGFEIDPESLKYYRDDGVSSDGTARYYTWFDPDTGE